MRAALLLLAVLSWPRTAQAQGCEFPGVLVVLDRSSSMQSQIGGESKWDIAVGALEEMLATHGGQASYGLMLYPGPSGTGANGVEGRVGACRYNRADVACTRDAPRCTTGEVVVDIDAGTADRILEQLAWPPGLRYSYTPTWQSLEAAHRYGRLHVGGRRNFVVLITDGWQCCGLYNNDTSCEREDRNLPVEKVAQLLGDGVRTFVIGFGGSVDVETLQRMAVAGDTARRGCDPDLREVGGNTHCYYQANNHAQLRRMLDGIGREIADEICDGRDNDCDGGVDEDLHQECRTACGPGTEECRNGGWAGCSADNPQAEECDGADNNCNGLVDELLIRPCATACGVGVEACEEGRWLPCTAPQPGEEVCDGVDNDCDDAVDPGCECRPGETRVCGTDEGECSLGTQGCEGDGGWGPCEGGTRPVAEVCDGRDNDCDGATDGLGRDCQTPCGGGEETCVDGRWQGCDAPGAVDEFCDGEDNDCDGRVDEGMTRSCRSPCGLGVERCKAGLWVDCSARQPSALERCDNGLDDDCDGLVEEDCACTDGAVQPCGADLGECAPGEQRCVGGHWDECIGGRPPAAESCNGLDDDCNNVVDDGDLCPAGQDCGCGACAVPCVFGECIEGVCLGGFCIVDACPPGRRCEDGVCVESGVDGEEGDGGAPRVPDVGLDGGEDGLSGDGAAAARTGSPADSCDCGTAPGASALWRALLSRR